MTNLPSGWVRLPLRELGVWYGGSTPPKYNPEFWTGGMIPWLSPKDMHSDTISNTRDHITELAIERTPIRVVPANSVAIVVRSGILERRVPVSLVPFEVTLNQDMKAISPHPYLDPRWLAWGLRSLEDHIIRNCRKSGTTVASIETKRLMDLEFPVPPLAEQRRIVAALEDHLSRLERGTAQLTSLIRRIDRFRDLLMTAACTGRLMAGLETGKSADGPAPANAVDGDLPEIPGHWRWARLGEIAEVVGGVTKDSKKQSDPTLPEVPYLRVANVQRGRLDLSTVTYIRVPEQKAKQLELQPGDVLLNEGGDRDKLGRGWIWEGQIPGCIHQNHVFRARIRDGLLHPKLLAWHANGFGKRWCEVNGKQSVNLASISLSKIKMLPVPLPPPEEQERLVAEAEQYLTILDSTEQAARAALARAHELRKALLAEAFAGRLVEQDPADEPASVLLERIRAERAARKPARRARRSKSGTAPQKETLV